MRSRRDVFELCVRLSRFRILKVSRVFCLVSRWLLEYARDMDGEGDISGYLSDLVEPQSVGAELQFQVQAFFY